MSGPVFDVMGHLQLNLGLKTLTPTKFPFFVAVVRILRRFPLGIISNPDLSGLDNSTYASNFSMLVFIEPLYHLRFEHRIARPQRVSLLRIAV